MNHFKQQAGRGPSPLQYFVAAIGFRMFSQLQRLAKKAGVSSTMRKWISA
jgi:hypothetical protein